ncbi:MAG: AAA family ATPase [Elusimicrobiota bacterium]|jgi:ATP-dependent Clp protease ATP-binding subunit ClpC
MPFSRLIAAILSASILLTCPGPGVGAALAQTVSGSASGTSAAGNTGVAGVQTGAAPLQPGVSGTPALKLSPVVDLSLSNAPTLKTPAAQASALPVAVSAGRALVPAAQLPAAVRLPAVKKAVVVPAVKAAAGEPVKESPREKLLSVAGELPAMLQGGENSAKVEAARPFDANGFTRRAAESVPVVRAQTETRRPGLGRSASSDAVETVVPAPSDFPVSPRSGLQWQRALPAVVVGAAIGLLALEEAFSGPLALGLIAIAVYGALFTGGDRGYRTNPPPSGKRPAPPPAPPAPARSTLKNVLPGVLVGTAALGLLAAFGLVTPYAAALPMFLLAGTLSGDSEAPPVEKALAELQRRWGKGERVSEKDLKGIVVAAGIASKSLLVDAAVERGLLMPMANKDYLRLGIESLGRKAIPGRSETFDDSSANELLRQALADSLSAKSESHAAAAYRILLALQQYATYKKDFAQAHPNEALANQMFTNAALNTVKALLGEAASGLRGLPDTDSRHDPFDELGNWVNGQYAAGRYQPTPMPAKALKAALRLLGSAEERPGVGDEYLSAYRTVAGYLRDHLGRPGPDAAPEAPRTADAEDVRELRGELIASADGGDVLSETAVRASAYKLKMTGEILEQVLARLQADGDLVRLHTGEWMVTVLHLAPGGRNFDDGDAQQRLRIALHEFPHKSLEDRAGVLVGLSSVVDEFARYREETGDDHPNAKMALALRNDAAMALALLVAEKTGGEGNPALEAAKTYLRRSSFAAGRAPAGPTPAESAGLGVLANLVLKFGAQGPVNPATGVALGAAAAFMGELAKQPAPAALPAPAAPDEPKAPAPKPYVKLSASEFPNLAKYGSDLTAAAAEGKLHPLIGRDKEIRQLVKVLQRVEKNNPVVTGEKGVGKTKVVEGLAQRIVDGSLPSLQGKIIVKLDMGAMLAGTKYRGDFEERIKGVLAEVKKSNGRVLLFIDEIHQILGMGDSDKSGTDAAGLMKEALVGDISVIGATTLKEYTRLEKDPALARRFQEVRLDAPTPEEAVAILEGVKARYEKKHGVSIPAETVKAVVKLAARYQKERALPDSALDLLDDAASEVQLQAEEAAKAGKTQRTEVKPEDVAFEVFLRTGIPVQSLSEDDKALLQRMPVEIKAAVIGQDEAVDTVVRAVRRARMGYRDPNQPIGVFTFLGPTGVGKTELAKALARFLFQSEAALLRFDMSEYMEKHNASRLVSAPPGYVGYEEGGQLTEPVRRNPYRVILLDEIEKAHPDVLKMFLQVFDDGRMTDGHGRTVDFTNTVIIMTSNAGGSLAQSKHPIGFGDGRGEKTEADAVQRETYVDAFKDLVAPEFFNRIGKDHVLVFKTLERKALEKILDIRLAVLNKTILAPKRMSAALTPAAREHLLATAGSAENLAYGARPIKQMVERQVYDALADAELEGKLSEGDQAEVDFFDGSFVARRAAPVETKLSGWLLAGAPILAALLPAAWTVPAALVLAAAAAVYWLARRPAGLELSRAYLARKRAAALLAVLGVAGSAPRLSAADREALIARFQARPPRAVIMDYDDTFMDNSSGKGLVVTPERLALLQALKDAGIRPIFATNRPLNGGPHGMENMLMDRMDASLREGFILSVGGGAEVYQYGPDGEKPTAPAFSETPMTLEEKGLILSLMNSAASETGFASADWREDGKDHEFTFVLKNDRPAARKLAAAFEKRFAGKFGLEFNVTYKEPPKESLEPYIRIAKATKARAIAGILKTLEAEGSAPAPADVVIFGDDFTKPGYDAAMARALPGAVVYAVGKDADPRLDNVYLSPVVGPDSTAEFLEELLPAGPAVRAPRLPLSYRIRRTAAALLAALGLAVSAPRLPAQGEQALLERFRAHPPRLVVLDYDRTFMDVSGVGTPVSAERIELLRRLKAAGIRTAFSTNRPLTGGFWGMQKLVMDRLPADLREGFLLATDGGAEVYRYGKDGEPPSSPFFAVPAATDAEAVRVVELLETTAKELSFAPQDWRDDGRMLELYTRFDKAFRAAGFSDENRVLLRYPEDLSLPAEVRVVRATKADGLRGLLGALREERVMVADRDILIFGDDFALHGQDAAMANAHPGATTLAVGKSADPRVGGVHLLPSVGPDATAGFLSGILRPPSAPKTGALPRALGSRLWLMVLAAVLPHALHVAELPGSATATIAPYEREVELHPDLETPTRRESTQRPLLNDVPTTSEPARK